RQHQRHGEVGREEQHDVFHDGLKTLSGIEGWGEGIEARRHSTVGDLRFASFGGGKRLFKGCDAAPRGVSSIVLAILADVVVVLVVVVLVPVFLVFVLVGVLVGFLVFGFRPSVVL